jgi:hypothetical protein
VRSGGASSLAFDVDGEWLQSSSDFASSSGGSGGVSSSSMTSRMRLGRGEKVRGRAARARAHRQWERGMGWLTRSILMGLGEVWT